MSRLTSLPGLALRRARSRILFAAAPFGAHSALVSYPKSGRTWFRFILSNYVNEVFELGVRVDLSSMFALIPNYAGDAQRGVGAWRQLGRREGLPLILVSHLPFRRAQFRQFPILFMIRNPHDVMVSSYFHRTRHKHQFSGDISEFLRDGRYGLRPYIEYHNTWARALPERRSMVLSYEDLTADALGATERAVAFLGLKQDAAALRRSVEASSFQRMRAAERKAPIPDHEYDVSDTDSLRVRRGQVGGYRSVLSAEDIAWINATCKAELDPAARRLFNDTG